MVPDLETCLRAMGSRDPRFDGWFFVAVTTTGIYCRPSCPATAPRRENVRIYPTAAGAQAAGFRACLRCRPDAAPGSPQWNLRADVAGRAMRLIADGVVDREGVEGLARRLAYSPRHLRRLLVEQLGASPLDLARAQRAQTARLLIETTTLPFNDVAFAAGFASLRQFNDTVRAIFALTPTEIRRRAGKRRQAGASPPAASRLAAATPAAAPELGALVLRLPRREPFDGAAVLRFLAARAVPGVEEVAGGTYRRTLRLPHGDGLAELTPRADHVECTLRLGELRDLSAAVERCRALFDLDADPQAVDAALGADPILGGLVDAAPGRRVPGAVDGTELAVRAVIGQQVSVAGARTVAARLATSLGRPLLEPHGALRVMFPSAEALASADPALLPLPATRRRTVLTLARAIAERRIVVSAAAERDELRGRLLQIPGIGEWTVAYVLMRLGDTDAFPATDHGVRRALETIGVPAHPSAATSLAEAWRPWRAYAVQHLWDVAAPTPAPVTHGQTGVSVVDRRVRAWRTPSRSR
jgi:AraC family transcriptional regulator, regulatory protein of adaptative response / DNA-3-methyladenine glycosylase II